MDHDDRPPLRSRLRWGNIARACAVMALAATIIAWPRLTPREPALPPVDPVPVAPAKVAPGAAAGGSDAAQEREAARQQERTAARRRSAERDSARREARERMRGAARARSAPHARARRRSPRATPLEAAGPVPRRRGSVSPPPAVAAPSRAAPRRPTPARSAPTPEFRPGGGEAPTFSLG